MENFEKKNSIKISVKLSLHASHSKKFLIHGSKVMNRVIHALSL